MHLTLSSSKLLHHSLWLQPMFEPFIKTNDFLVGHSKLGQLGYPIQALPQNKGFGKLS